MAKIILTKDGKLLQEIALKKERITIGRRPHNDIVIEDVAISGEHAVIALGFNDVLLEDVNSTNGTQVNGQPIRKHFLQNQDVIELAGYRLLYVADAGEHEENSASRGDSARCAVNLDQMLNNISPQRRGAVTASDIKRHSGCVLRLLTGTDAGKEITIEKPLTTVGQPGLQIAAVARDEGGFYLSHVEGDVRPLINGHSVGTGLCAISHGDVIELVGARLKFLTY